MAKQKEAKKQIAKAAEKPVEQKPAVSRSSMAIATALVKHYPKDAPEIIKCMFSAATSSSMKRKLDRVRRALESMEKAGA